MSEIVRRAPENLPEEISKKLQYLRAHGTNHFYFSYIILSGVS